MQLEMEQVPISQAIFRSLAPPPGMTSQGQNSNPVYHDWRLDQLSRKYRLQFIIHKLPTYRWRTDRQHFGILWKTINISHPVIRWFESRLISKKFWIDNYCPSTTSKKLFQPITDNTENYVQMHSNHWFTFEQSQPPLITRRMITATSSNELFEHAKGSDCMQGVSTKSPIGVR